MRRVWTLLAVATLSTAGCKGNERELNTALAESKNAAAEKDSLLTEVLAISGFVNDVNQELAKVKGLGAVQPTADRGVPGPERDRAARTATLARIGHLIQRLDTTQSQLAQSRTRAQSFKRKDARLLAQITEYEQTISQLKSSAEQQQAELQRQQAEIVALHQQVDTFTAENTRLVADKVALTDTVTNLTTYKNKVYYVVGTKKELIAKGVVVNEGSKFLFFGGKHLEPARSLPTDAFTELDKTKATSIPLPHDDKGYKIISRQSPEYLAAASSKDGKLKGALQIESPEQFWAPSKYLIIVED